MDDQQTEKKTVNNITFILYININLYIWLKILIEFPNHLSQING